MSVAYETTLVVRQGYPLVTKMDPFEIYEVLVPASLLRPHLEHWLAVTYDGGDSVEPIVSRKQKKLNTEKAFNNSDFNKRHGRKMSKALKDIKYEGEFSLTDRLTYEDDPDEQVYEIIYKDKNPYLVFQVSFVRVSMSYDDDSMYDEIPVSLALYPEQHIFSTLEPFTH